MFHDFSRLREASQKTIDFTTVPVLVKGGVFHPKLIVVSGKKTNSPDERVVRVMISSANLTYAGWGSNLEAGGVIEVRDRHQAEPLVILLQWLLERATEAVDDKKTISFIERFNTVITFLQDRMNVEPTDNSPLVHVTIPDHVGRENPPGLQPLLQWLLHRRTGDLVIAAPYFSGQKFFEEIAQEFAGRAITIAPGVSQGNLVEFDTETLEYLENSRFKLARLEQPKGDDEDRRQHLKCFAHKNGVIVGSHNASYHALGSALEHGPGPKNVEVSVEFPGRSIGHMIHSTKPGELKPKNDPSEPPLPVPWAGKVPILVLTVDWKERLITLRQIAGGDSEPAQYGIKFPGVDLPISLDTFDIKERNGVLKLEHVDAKSLAETKKFEVHALAETPSFRYVGFINETNREERDRRYESTLADCWRSYIAPLDRDLKPSLNAVSMLHNNGLSDREIDLVGLTQNRTHGRLDNYFPVFRATTFMRQRLEHAGDDDKAVEKQARLLLRDGPGCIERIIELMKKAMPMENDEATQPHERMNPVTRGLVARELLSVLDQIATRLPGYFHEDITEFRTDLNAFDAELRELLGSMNDKRIDILAKLIHPEVVHEH